MSNNYTQEPARRMFAEELHDSTYTFQDKSDDDNENKTNYTALPTGGAANRVHVVGTLTEVEDVGSDSEFLRGRVVGPTGTFFVYGGQYQPQAASALRSLEAPSYVAVTGKFKQYEPDNGETMVSIDPEYITETTAEARDRWVVETAVQTTDRVAQAKEVVSAMAKAEVEDNLESLEDENISIMGVPFKAQWSKAEYDVTEDALNKYRDAAISALESVDEQVQASSDSSAQSSAEQEVQA